MNFIKNKSQISTKSIIYSSIIYLLLVSLIIASTKKKNIGSEVVNVVKPYTPTISDALKLKKHQHWR
jgi:hypothetical protein